MLDWDDVRYFLAVARGGSFSAAAAALGVAQPTVGRRLAAFEGGLGAELFEATPSGQVLTETGLRLLSTAERMELEALTVERVASGRDVGVRGRVRITSSEWLIERLLAPLVAPFSLQHPELEVELWADVRHLSLVRREADIALRPSRFEHAQIVERAVGFLRFGLYASDAYLLAHGMPDFGAQCRGHRLIAMSEPLRKVPDLDFLPKIAAEARIVARANSRETMVKLTASGVGLACLPRFVGDATAGLRHLTTPEPEPRRRLYLGYHSDARATPRIKACMAHLSAGIERMGAALAP
jgi:DNA-binding transcriptional LysR family regulator